MWQLDAQRASKLGLSFGVSFLDECKVAVLKRADAISIKQDQKAVSR